MENGIQKPRSGLCVHWLLLAYHFSQALSVNQTKKYMYVCIHIYIYICVFTDWKPLVHTNTSHSNSAPQGSFQSPLPLHICISLPHQRESCLPLASTCQFLCSISICNQSPSPHRASQKTSSWGHQPVLAVCSTLQHPPCGPTVTLLPSSSIYISHATIFLLRNPPLPFPEHIKALKPWCFHFSIFNSVPHWQSLVAEWAVLFYFCHIPRT